MKSEGLVQFIKFGVVGVANTAVDWIVFYVLNLLVFTSKESEPVAKAISFVVAVINSYIWNSIWTFKKEFNKTAKSAGEKGTIFVKFFVVSLIGWGINYLAFKYARFNLSQGQLVSLVVASGAGILWNFFGNKLWTYKKS